MVNRKIEAIRNWLLQKMELVNVDISRLEKEMENVYGFKRFQNKKRINRLETQLTKLGFWADLLLALGKALSFVGCFVQSYRKKFVPGVILGVMLLGKLTGIVPFVVGTIANLTILMSVLTFVMYQMNIGGVKDMDWNNPVHVKRVKFVFYGLALAKIIYRLPFIVKLVVIIVACDAMAAYMCLNDMKVLYERWKNGKK